MIKSIKEAILGGPIILFAIGLVFFGIGGGLTYRQIIFRQDAIQVPGEVIELSESCDDEGCSYKPTVRFTTLAGETIFYHSNYGSNPPEYNQDDNVMIYYKADNPEKVIITGEGSIFRFIFMGIGGLIILAGMVFFALNLRNSLLFAS